MEVFLKVGTRRGTVSEQSIDFDELGLSEVIELLDNVNIEAVVKDFGDRNPRENPVIHFYGLFLQEYDAEQRIRRRDPYTPPLSGEVHRQINR